MRIVLLIPCLSTICGTSAEYRRRTLTSAPTPNASVTQPLIVRDVLPNGLRLLTERMPHVRSVSIGVWLARGSRHEPQEQSGIAHFVEHMLFKGTATRSAEDIAQTIDHRSAARWTRSPRRNTRATTSRCSTSTCRWPSTCSSDIVRRPAFSADDIEREKKVVLEEIKMVEDTPDDLVHELFTENFWDDHPLGRPILGTKETVEALTRMGLRRYFDDAIRAPNIDHRGGRQHRAPAACAISSRRRSAPCSTEAPGVAEAPPRVVPRIIDPQQGARTEPRLPRHEQLPAGSRGSLFELRAEHRCSAAR